MIVLAYKIVKFVYGMLSVTEKSRYYANERNGAIMRRKRFPFIFLLAFATLATPFSNPLRADQNSPTVIFVFDASGSMWGRLEDKIKMDAAKDIMTGLLTELPAEVGVGLVAYGHRRKGDCTDVEMLVAPERGGGDKAAEAIRKLIPKGKTPLAAAFALIGSYLKQHEGDATVVLVSDGRDTCGGAPCNAAKKLRGHGGNIGIHVVGFDVSDRAAEQLRCIAGAGGGRYFQADTVEGLATTLSAVIDYTVTGPPLPEPPPKRLVEASPAQTKRVGAGDRGTVLPAPAPWVLLPPRYWLLLDAESGHEAARSSVDTVSVKPGTYQIAWKSSESAADEVKLSEVITVAAGDKIIVALDTGIHITVPEGVKAPYEWRLINSEQETVAAYKNNLDPQLVPAGSYHLLWRRSEHNLSEVDLGAVVIRPGELTELVIDHGIVVQLPAWLSPPYYYSLRDEQGHQFKLTEAGTQLLPPGVYQLSWKQSEFGFSEIKWGEVTVPAQGFTDVAVDSGLTILAGDSPPPYRIFAEDETGAWAEMADSWGPMPLPPGVYKIEMQERQQDGSRVTLVKELPIEKGQLLEIEM